MTSDYLRSVFIIPFDPKNMVPDTLFHEIAWRQTEINGTFLSAHAHRNTLQHYYYMQSATSNLSQSELQGQGEGQNL